MATIVSFHAHPDDEALLTGGTLARLAAEGHRVVLVVATAGEAGLAAGEPPEVLGPRRRAELEASRRALGLARVEVLGFPDSGSATPLRPRPAGTPPRFAELPVDEAAAPLADLLRAEAADVLTTYDAAGGYGHPDHVAVHRVGARAAALAGTPLVLEATFDRDLFARLVRSLAIVRRVAPVPQLPDPASAYTPRRELTHRVDVRAQVPAKLAALRAHASQGGRDRTVTWLTRLPGPVARWALGREYFREVGRVPGTRPLDDPLASLGAGRH
jgi:LmbE family N-acetylglucosaminyl deacetylase